MYKSTESELPKEGSKALYLIRLENERGKEGYTAAKYAGSNNLWRDIPDGWKVTHWDVFPTLDNQKDPNEEFQEGYRNGYSDGWEESKTDSFKQICSSFAGVLGIQTEEEVNEDEDNR